VQETRLISKSLLRQNFSSIPSPIKPKWLKVHLPSKGILETKKVVNRQKLTTVCEEAMCPNLNECWTNKHATFMILGDVCTRSCSFCNIQTGRPKNVDEFEPLRVARAVKDLELKHVVITSVDRDDLSDGGALHFYKTVKMIKKLSPDISIEILTPDFRNKKDYLEIISSCEIDVFNHNLETVKNLYNVIRPGANYLHSLSLLETIKNTNQNILTKSGIMIGLGEEHIQIKELLNDLRSVNVDFLTIGQYLRPSLKHYPVIQYYSHDYFDTLKKIAIEMGFKAVTSSPFARSSYKSEDEHEIIKSKINN
tara:strand:- start:228 stop:1154 length:927 start_codon:yes stop_codon:yes gene_type:complete